MAKFCTSCGQELIESAKACGNCGAPVSGETTTVKATPASTTTVNVQAAAPAQTNGMAIAGFVVSLVSTLLCCGAFNIVSLILSIVGLVQAKNYNGNGKGLAIAGIIISCIFMILSILLVILGYGAAFFEEFA